MHAVPNIGNILSRTAQAYGPEPGFVFGGDTWTWDALEAEANALAAALAHFGIRKGDRVAIQARNGRALFEAMFAITRVGGVYVPVNARATPTESLQMLQLCDARIVLAAPEFAAIARSACDACDAIERVVVIDEAPGGIADMHAGAADWHLWSDLLRAYNSASTLSVSVDRDDIAWHNFTSGTTGVPKGGLNSHGGLGVALLDRLAAVTPNLGASDVMLAIAWLGHGTGTMTTVSTMVGARTVALAGQGFDPEETWRTIRAHGVTTTFTVPTILMRLLRHVAAHGDRSGLRHVVVAGAAIPPADLDLAISLLGESLVQYYGAVEAVGAGAAVRPAAYPPGSPKRYSVGRPRPATDLMIAGEAMTPQPAGEIGEICLRGPGVFSGYYKDGPATGAVYADGWYRTGDLGRQDGEGFVTIVGRSKEMFKSGGLQVYPNEIKDHLTRQDAVEDAYVVPVSDSDLGEVGVAMVRLKPGQSANEGELLARLGESLARYKLPRRIFFVEDFPKNANGKVSTALLKALLEQRGLVVDGQDLPRAPVHPEPVAAEQRA